MNRLLLLVMFTATLTACKAEAPGDTPAATTTAAPAPSVATYNGYDRLVFGMNALEVRQASVSALGGAPAAGKGCYYFTADPAPDALAFMMEGDKFVRYDVGNAQQVAPGGGRVGMTADEIRRLYSDRLEEQPHARLKGARYLRVKAGDSNNALLFETDTDGKVSSWRVGQKPYVDYPSRCD